MKKLLFTGVLTGLIFSTSAFASTITLDFTTSPSLEAALDDNTYGDSAIVDLSYRAIDANSFGDVATTGGVSGWGSGYGDLDGALWGEPNPSHAEIRIDTIDPMATVTIDSFDMGGWLSDEVAEWYIYDISWNLVSSGTGIAPNTNARLSVTPSSSATGGIIFQWGNDAWDVGVENFTFTVSGQSISVSAPSTLLLIFLSMGVLGVAGWRRAGKFD